MSTDTLTRQMHESREFQDGDPVAPAACEVAE